MVTDLEYTPSSEQIDAVLVFLSTFVREDFVPSRIEAPPGIFPHHIQSEELIRFQQGLYENGFICSFDWPSWQEEALMYFNQPELLHNADIQVLRKLLTLHVRNDRFTDGHLSAMVKCGHITAILQRLADLRRDAGSSGEEKTA
jgi:hypothetical protein